MKILSYLLLALIPALAYPQATVTRGGAGGKTVQQSSLSFVTPDIGAATATSVSIGADPADAGEFRLPNAGIVAWEASPAGTDITQTVNASEQFVFSNDILSPSLATSLVTSSATFALLNTTATTVNAFGSATTINLGNSAGTTNLLGTLALNPGGSAAGAFSLSQGTAASAGTTNITFYAPAAVTSYTRRFAGAAFTGFSLWTNTAGDMVETGVTPGTGVATALAVNVGSAGAFVVNGGALGTPSSGTLTSATGLPISTGVSGLGTGVATFLATPSSANLAAALTDETGTGVAVFGTSPAFTTNFTLANSASPTTSTVAQTAFDTDAWAASRGAVQVYDGTANTFLVGALASDTPTNGQVPTWNTGGTITWETPSGGGTPGGSDTQVQFNNAGAFGGDAGLTYNLTTNVLTNTGGQFVGTSGTVTASTPIYAGSQTWNNAGVNFLGFVLDYTNTASGANSSTLRTTVGGVTVFDVDKTGATFIGKGLFMTNASSNITMATNSTITWGATRGTISFPANGSMVFGDSSGNAFLQFGGATSSFPGIKRSTTSLQVRLADDSADAALSAAAITSSSSIRSTSATGGIGYSTGAGSTVTQATNRTTAVTLNNTTGTITTNNASLAALTAATFTVNNTSVAIADTPVLAIRSGQTNKETHVYVSAVAANSFDITVYNASAVTAETGTIVINFSLLKGSAN